MVIFICCLFLLVAAFAAIHVPYELTNTAVKSINLLVKYIWEHANLIKGRVILSDRSMEEVQPDLFPRVFQLTEELPAWNTVGTTLDSIPRRGMNPRPLLGQTAADVVYLLEPATYQIGRMSWIKFWEMSTNSTRGTCSYAGCTNEAWVGGHIWLKGKSDGNKYCYIAPICWGCNNYQSIKRSREAEPQSKLKKVMVVRICLSDRMRKDDDVAVENDDDDVEEEDAVKKDEEEAGDEGLSDKINNLKLRE